MGEAVRTAIQTIERGAGTGGSDEGPGKPDRSGSGSSPLTGAALAWAIGVAPVVARMLGHGTNGVRAGVALGILTFAAVGVLQLVVFGRRATVAFVGLFALGAVVTWSTVGRAPALVAFTGAALGAASFAPLSHLLIVSSGRPRSRLAAAPIVFGASLSWALTGSTVASACGFGLAALVLLGYRRWSFGRFDDVVWQRGGATAESVDDLWSSASAAVGRAASAAGRFGRSVVGSGGDALRRVVAAASSGAKWLVAPANRPIVLSGLFVGLITAPIFRRVIAQPWVLVRGTNDVPGTIDRAEWMQLWPLRMPVPHPGWSVAARTLMEFVGEVAAVTLILSIATGAGVAVLITIGRSWWDDERRLEWPFACALGIGYFLMENPAVLVPQTEDVWGRYPQAGELAQGQGYMPLHQWATPTITLSMPFALALFALLLLVVRSAEVRSPHLRRRAVALSVLTVVSTLVQPASTLALVPALPVYLVLARRWSARVVRPVAVSFVLPGTVIVLAQVWFLVSNVSPWEQATWIWDPFWTLGHFGMLRVSFWLTLLFFPLCIWIGGRRYVSVPGVQLSFVALVITALPFLMLEQTTVAELKDGDLGVPMLMSFVFLFVTSLRFVLGEYQEIWRKRSATDRLPAWALVMGGFLLLMLVAGVVDLLSAGGFIEEI